MDRTTLTSSIRLGFATLAAASVTALSSCAIPSSGRPNILTPYQNRTYDNCVPVNLGTHQAVNPRAGEGDFYNGWRLNAGFKAELAPANADQACPIQFRPAGALAFLKEITPKEAEILKQCARTGDIKDNFEACQLSTPPKTLVLSRGAQIINMPVTCNVDPTPRNVIAPGTGQPKDYMRANCARDNTRYITITNQSGQTYSIR